MTIRPRRDRDPYIVLPLDPRDPAVLRAKQLLRDRHATAEKVPRDAEPGIIAEEDCSENETATA